MSVEGMPRTHSQPSQWTCPACGAAAEKGVGQIAADGSTGTVVCGKCGARSPEVPVDAQLGVPVPPPAPAPSSRNPLALVVVALIAAAMLYFGFHMSHNPGPAAPGVLGKSTPAPDFTLESLDGKSTKLSDFRGKAVLLNFWATWCGPCKIETPWLVELQQQYAGQGLQVVGVAMDDSGKDEIAKFAKDMGMNYPVLIGKEAVGDAYGGVPALPESFFIGRDGKITGKIMGIDSKSVIEEEIKKALNTPSSGAPSATLVAPTALQAQK